MKVKKMNDDTEVREIENERAAAVRQMMDQWKDGNLTDAQDTFNGMMNQRADELVAGRKAEVALQQCLIRKLKMKKLSWKWKLRMNLLPNPIQSLKKLPKKKPKKNKTQKGKKNGNKKV